MYNLTTWVRSEQRTTKYLFISEWTNNKRHRKPICKLDKIVISIVTSGSCGLASISIVWWVNCTERRPRGFWNLNHRYFMAFFNLIYSFSSLTWLEMKRHAGLIQLKQLHYCFKFIFCFFRLVFVVVACRCLLFLPGHISMTDVIYIWKIILIKQY